MFVLRRSAGVLLVACRGIASMVANDEVAGPWGMPGGGGPGEKELHIRHPNKIQKLNLDTSQFRGSLLDPELA